MTNTHDFEEGLMQVVNAAVEPLKGADTYFAEAGARFLIRELCHALLDQEAMTNEDLAEHLDVMATVVRERRAGDTSS